MKKKIAMALAMLVIFAGVIFVYVFLPEGSKDKVQPKEADNLQTMSLLKNVDIEIGSGYKLVKKGHSEKELTKVEQEQTVFEIKDDSKTIGDLKLTVRKIDNGDVVVYQEVQYEVSEEMKLPMQIVVKNSDNYSFFKMAEDVSDREHNKTFGVDMTSNVRGIYDFNTEEKTTASIYLSQNYVSKQLVQEYEDGATSRVRELLKENQEYSIDELGGGYVIKNDMMLLPEADHSESWFIVSDDKLVQKETVKEAYKEKTNYNFVQSTKWQVSDGNYTKLPWSIEPGVKMGYGRNLVAMQDDTALNFYRGDNDNLFYDLAVISVNNLQIFKGEKNLWETEYTSTWLKKQYGIEAPYVDTRHNENIALFLGEAAEYLNVEELMDSPVAYADYLTRQKEMGNIIQMEEGYYIADYFSEKAKMKTHVSLNHALGEANFLLEQYKERKNQLYAVTAFEIFDAVNSSGEKWIMENGDLAYQIDGEGVYSGTDYDTLTLEDLTYSINLLDQLMLLDEYPNLEKLMLSKLKFAMEKEFDLPKSQADLLIKLGYGDLIEGYEYILSI